MMKCVIIYWCVSITLLLFSCKEKSQSRAPNQTPEALKLTTTKPSSPANANYFNIYNPYVRDFNIIIVIDSNKRTVNIPSGTIYSFEKSSNVHYIIVGETTSEYCTGSLQVTNYDIGWIADKREYCLVPSVSVH